LSHVPPDGPARSAPGTISTIVHTSGTPAASALGQEASALGQEARALGQEASALGQEARALGQEDRPEAAAVRPSVRGKSLYLGERKLTVKGVT
jgi:hypothetical protein